jgi:hypothetical protein
VTASNASPTLSRDVGHAGADPAGGDRPRRTRRGHIGRDRDRPVRGRNAGGREPAAFAPMPKAARDACLRGASLTRLLEKEQGTRKAIVEDVSVPAGYEAALGAALADDLNAPKAGKAGESGWSTLPGYDEAAPLPGGAEPLASVVNAPDALARRISQIGLVVAADGPRLQAELLPGQRLVSREGDLWRWDGFAVGAADAVSGTARRLEQKNRLSALSAEAAEADAKAPPPVRHMRSGSSAWRTSIRPTGRPAMHDVRPKRTSPPPVVRRPAPNRARNTRRPARCPAGGCAPPCRAGRGRRGRGCGGGGASRRASRISTRFGPV